jgi:hypothetical protein
MRSNRLAGASFVLVSLLTGCGASSGVSSSARESYDQQMLAVGQRYAVKINSASRPLPSAMKHGQAAKEAAIMLRVGLLYRGEADALARIKAPRDAASMHSRIVAAYRQATRWTAAMAAEFRNPGTVSPRSLRNQWHDEIRVALRQLHAKGYEVTDVTFEGVPMYASGY